MNIMNNSSDLECLCVSYDPSAVPKVMGDVSREFCESSFLTLVDTFNAHSTSTISLGHSSACELNVNALQIGFCGFPWDLDSFAVDRSILCAQSDRFTCHRETYRRRVDCKWYSHFCLWDESLSRCSNSVPLTLSRDITGRNWDACENNHSKLECEKTQLHESFCAAQPTQSMDANGICKSKTSETACNGHTFTVSGSCRWHETLFDRYTTYQTCCHVPSEWCQSAGMEFDDEVGAKPSGFLNYSCRDIAQTFNRDDMLDSDYSMYVDEIDVNCCVPSPSESPPSLVPTIIHSFLPSVNNSFENYEIIGIDQGTEEMTNNESTIMLYASVPLIFGIGSYLWKHRKKVISSKDNVTNEEEVDDPSRYEHVEPSQLEFMDPSQFEHVDPANLEHVEP